MVCECLLCHEKLQYQEADFWVESFHLIRKIIGGVDYKGVREIMKVIELLIYFSLDWL